MSVRPEQLIVLAGPPGVGKNTHGAMLESHGITFLDTGAELRKSRSYLLGAVGQTMDNGRLVDNTTVIGIVNRRFERLLRHDFLARVALAGYPRKVKQTEDMIRRWLSRGIYVFFLDAPKELCVESIEQATDRGDRLDDSSDKREQRYLEYQEHTLPAIRMLMENPQVKSLIIRREKETSPQTVARKIEQALSLSRKRPPAVEPQSVQVA